MESKKSLRLLTKFFVYAKEKNCRAEHKAKGAGDVWTWTAICADSKLIPCWFVGNRDAGSAYHFIHDLKGRLANRVQLTTDGHRAYLSAVEDVFTAFFFDLRIVTPFENSFYLVDCSASRFKF